MRIEKLDLLKHEVENTLGKKILSTSDCQQLSTEVFRKTGLSISINTLRRIFDLMKSQYQPSIFTMDLLAKYSGFSNYSSFSSQIREKSNGQEDDTESWIINLLGFPFKWPEIKGLNKFAYLNTVNELLNNLQDYPTIIDKFQQQLSKTPNGQKLYFEKFVNIDELNGVYGRGLMHYMLENQTVQARVFATSLLCFSSYLNLDTSKLYFYHNELLKYKRLKKELSFKVQARMLTADLFVARASHSDSKSARIQLRHFYQDYKLNALNLRATYTVEIVIAEALILVEEFGEALLYLDEVSQNETDKETLSVHNQNTLESFKVLKAIALANTGDLQNANYLAASVNVEKFNPLTKSFYKILYFNLLQSFKYKDSVRVHIEELLRKTGFKCLAAQEYQFHISS